MLGCRKALGWQYSEKTLLKTLRKLGWRFKKTGAGSRARPSRRGCKTEGVERKGRRKLILNTLYFSKKLDSEPISLGCAIGRSPIQSRARLDGDRRPISSSRPRHLLGHELRGCSTGLLLAAASRNFAKGCSLQRYSPATLSPWIISLHKSAQSIKTVGPPGLPINVFT